MAQRHALFGADNAVVDLRPVPRLLRIDISDHFHRGLEVGEQDRDLLALAFERVPGVQDLLGATVIRSCAAELLRAALAGTEDLVAALGAVKDLCIASDYPKEHFLHSNQNKKIPGLMKDEMNGKIIKEFIGLRSKMYSIKLFEDETEIKKAKGIPKNVVKNEIKHESYFNSLMNKII